MHVCLIYDCLYPWTVGGAERWYRNLADELVRAGHEVTYLTRRQWDDDAPPVIPGVRVVAVSPRDELYDADGKRRTLPPLRFGRGVLHHLAQHRGRYDAVHTCAFPYFSLLAARAALAGTGVPVAVDWFEVWTRDYWRGYIGGAAGEVGNAVQRLCVLLTPHAFVFSRLHAERLRAEGLRRPAQVLAGLYAGPLERRARDGEPEPVALFAGRHIPEKRVTLLPAAIAAARRGGWPELRGLVLGDGPEREALVAEVARLGLGDVVEVAGFVSAEEVDAAFARASCLVLPSVREGYGLVVIEAAAAGIPSVVVRAPDNAAVELVEDGVNGAIAEGPEPEAIAAALLRVRDGGAALRASTGAWFDEHAPRLTAAASARVVLEAYASARR